MDICKIIKAFFINKKLNLRGKKILVGCSGGPDSMALTYSLMTLREDFGYELGVCHIEHGIRGAISIDEAQFVASFCEKAKLPFYTKQVKIPELAKANNKSQELMAREIRYEFMAEITVKYSYDYLATGHHLNDQGETILMHLIRGTGPKGLVGMTSISQRRVKNVELNIIRPLLSISKEEILSYCQEKGISFCTDQSNFSTDYTRNKIRWQILPKIAELNPNILEGLANLSSLIQGQEAFINKYLTEKAITIIKKINSNCLACDINLLQEEEQCIRQGIFRLIYQQLNGSLLDLSSINIAILEDILYNGNVSNKIQLPKGIIVEKTYNQLIFTKGSNSNILSIPEKIVVDIKALRNQQELNYAFGDKLITIQLLEISSENDLQINRNMIALPLINIVGQLVIRPREPGDTICLANLGHKKVKNILIDEKIPLAKRDLIPIISDDEGILWIAGIRYSNRCHTQIGQLLYIKIN